MAEKEWIKLFKKIKSLDNEIEITVCYSDDEYQEIKNSKK